MKHFEKHVTFLCFFWHTWRSASKRVSQSQWKLLLLPADKHQHPLSICWSITEGTIEPSSGEKETFTLYELLWSSSVNLDSELSQWPKCGLTVQALLFLNSKYLFWVIFVLLLISKWQNLWLAAQIYDLNAFPYQTALSVRANYWIWLHKLDYFYRSLSVTLSFFSVWF